jgi:superfamily I DNA/RNA helicase
MNKILVAGTKRCEIAKKTSVTKYPLILEAANSYLNDPTSKNLSNLFYLFKQNSETNLCRRDLFNRFMNVLKVHISSSDLTLLEAANLYQKDFRYLGRPLRHTKQIATTLLVKGLEYDHAVILDAESLDARQLYVAMTRGAKSLTIISKESELPVL